MHSALQQGLHRAFSGQARCSHAYLEQHAARQQLSQDAAKGPYVNLLVVRQAQDHLGGSVAARLNIRTQVVTDETR